MKNNIKAQTIGLNLDPNALEKKRLPWQEAPSYFFREIVSTYSKCLGTSPEYIVASILTTMAQSAGAKLKCESYYKNYLQFYILIVGDVSTNKTQSFKRIFEPIYKFQEIIDNSWLNNDSKGTLKNLYFDDFTAEAYWDDMAKTPDGITIHADEFPHFFGNLKGYSQNPGIAYTFFTDHYNSHKRFRISRKNYKVFIPNPIPRIYGAIQPDELVHLLKDGKTTRCGLLQRFLIFYGDDTKPKRENVDTSKVDDEWMDFNKKLFDPGVSVDFTFSDKADKIYSKFHEDNENSKIKGFEKELICKLEIALIRLSMAMAAFRQYELKHSFDDKFIVIAEDEMEFSRKLIDYFLYTGIRANDDITSGESTSKEIKSLADYIRLGHKMNLIKNQECFAKGLGADPGNVSRYKKNLK